MKLILASTSPYRKALLMRLGLPFTCVAPGVDEHAFKRLGLAPSALAQKLAWEKARAVHQLHPKAIVIGGDQLAEIDGMILGKPHTSEHALEQLRLMRGKTHRLLTAVHLCGPGLDEPYLAVTQLRMRELSDQELSAYIERDRPLDCAGSYKIEQSGIKLFSEIHCDDLNTIQGLPLIWLQTALLKAGVSFFP